MDSTRTSTPLNVSPVKRVIDISEQKKEAAQRVREHTLSIKAEMRAEAKTAIRKRKKKSWNYEESDWGFNMFVEKQKTNLYFQNIKNRPPISTPTDSTSSPDSREALLNRLELRLNSAQRDSINTLRSMEVGIGDWEPPRDNNGNDDPRSTFFSNILNMFKWFLRNKLRFLIENLIFLWSHGFWGLGTTLSTVSFLFLFLMLYYCLLRPFCEYLNTFAVNSSVWERGWIMGAMQFFLIEGPSLLWNFFRAMLTFGQTGTPDWWGALRRLLSSHVIARLTADFTGNIETRLLNFLYRRGFSLQNTNWISLRNISRRVLAIEPIREAFNADINDYLRNQRNFQMIMAATPQVRNQVNREYTPVISRSVFPDYNWLETGSGNPVPQQPGQLRIFNIRANVCTRPLISNFNRAAQVRNAVRFFFYWLLH